jgi:hypothetical protein
MKILQEAIEQYQSRMIGTAMPPCFPNRDHWNDWVRLEREAKTEPRKFACRDCTRCYQKKMVQQGMCLIPEINVELITREKNGG